MSDKELEEHVARLTKMVGKTNNEVVDLRQDMLDGFEELRKHVDEKFDEVEKAISAASSKWAGH